MFIHRKLVLFGLVCILGLFRISVDAQILRNGLFGGLLGRNVGQEQPTAVGSSAADTQSRSFTNNLRVGRLFGITNTGSAASSNAILADGIENTVNSKSLSSSVNLVGIPITNTMSNTRTTSNIDGRTTGSISDHFGIGKVGLTSTFSKDKIGSGLGVSRDPQGGLDVHLGAFDFDFSKNHGQQVSTSAQADSEAQAHATGLKAESDTQSESSSKGINLGLIGLTSSRTKTTSHASAIDGTANTGVASNAKIVQDQNSGQFRPFGGFFRNMGSRIVQNFRPNVIVDSNKNPQTDLSNQQQQHEHTQFQYEQNYIHGNAHGQQNYFIPNQYPPNQQAFYQQQYPPYQQPVGQPIYQPNSQLNYPRNSQSILQQNQQQFDTSNQQFEAEQTNFPLRVPLPIIPLQPAVNSQGQRMPQLSPSQEEDLYAIFNQNPDTSSGVIRGPPTKNGPTVNNIFVNLDKDYGSKSDERKVRDNMEEAGGEYNLDVRMDVESQKRGKRQINPLLERIGETLGSQLVNDAVKKVSASLANSFGINGYDRQPTEYDQYHYHHHPHGHGDYHPHHHPYPHDSDYFIDKPPPSYENFICPDGSRPYWNYPNHPNKPPLPFENNNPGQNFANKPPLPFENNNPGQNFANKPPLPFKNNNPGQNFANKPPLPFENNNPGQNFANKPPLPFENNNPGQNFANKPPLPFEINNPGQNFANKPPLPFESNNPGQNNLPIPNFSNNNNAQEVPVKHKTEEEVLEDLSTSTTPLSIADDSNNVKDPVYDIDVRGDFNDRRRKREVISGQTETKQADFVFKDDENETTAKKAVIEDTSLTKSVENSEATETEVTSGDEESGELDSRFGLIGGHHRRGPIRTIIGGIVGTLVDEFSGRHDGISRPPPPISYPNGYDQYQFGHAGNGFYPQQPPIGIGSGFPNPGFNNAQQPPIINGPGFPNQGLYPQQPPIGSGPGFLNQGFPNQGFPNHGFPNQIQPIIPNQFGSSSSSESNAQSSFFQGNGGFVESNAGSNSESFVGPGGISGSQSSSHASSIGTGGLGGATGAVSSASSGAFGGNVGGFGSPFPRPFFGLRSGEDDTDKTEVEVEKKEEEAEEAFVFE